MESTKLLEKVVDSLNEDIWKKEDFYDYTFSFIASTHFQAISFENIELWNSEDEGREFNEKENKYEDLEVYCKKRFIQIVDEYYEIAKIINL